MYDAICQNKADQLFTLFLLLFYYLHLMAKKQTILYMLVILQHRKDSIGRLRRKPLGFISSPLIWKRTICGIRVVAGDDVHVSYYVYYKICPNADFTRPMYMGLWFFYSKLGGYNPAKSIIFSIP